MGQRANYVLVEGERWTLHYSHWAASTVDRDLFWGPEHAASFIRAQERTDEWLDDVWCEGGALMDVGRRVLLWFGGEDIRWNVLRHRLHLALMRRLWPGWTVRWAFEGLDAFVDHLGLPREWVRSRGRRELHKTRLEPTVEYVRSILSTENGVFAIDQDATDVFDFPVPEHLRGLPGARPLHAALWGDSSVDGGIHLDFAAMRAELWSPDYRPHLQAWDGWTLVDHGDRFEAQLEAASGMLAFQTPPQQEVTGELVSYLLGRNTFDPAEQLATIQRAAAGQKLEVNPHFLSHVNVELDEDLRARILSAALAGLADEPPLWG